MEYGAMVNMATDADHAAGVTDLKKEVTMDRRTKRARKKDLLWRCSASKNNFSLALWFIKAFRHRIVRSRQITHTARMDWTKKSKKM